MKKLLLTLTATLVCTGVFAQGKMVFQVNTTQLIYFTTDKTQLIPADSAKTVAGFSLAGSGAYTGAGGTIAALAGAPTFTAALFGGTSAGSLSLLTTTTIGNFNFEGQLNSVSMTFASLPAGTPAFFQIEIYDTRASSAPAAWTAGDYAGETAIFQATPGAAANPIYQTTAPVSSTLPLGQQALVDYPGAKGLIALYAVVPEPASFALAGLGAAALLIFRRRK